MNANRQRAELIYLLVEITALGSRNVIMSAQEILVQLPYLKPAELSLIRSRIDELEAHREHGADDWDDDDDPLGNDEKTLLEGRVAELERDPQISVPWSEIERQLIARYGA